MTGWGGVERRTHAVPRICPQSAGRGAVPGHTARGRRASGRGARTRPQRPAARSARGRRSAAPRRLRAARPGPTGPRPPGDAGPPRAPAGSKRALRGEGRCARLRPASVSGWRRSAQARTLPSHFNEAKTPLLSPENGSYLARLQTPLMRPGIFDDANSMTIMMITVLPEKPKCPYILPQNLCILK